MEFNNVLYCDIRKLDKCDENDTANCDNNKMEIPYIYILEHLAHHRGIRALDCT